MEDQELVERLQRGDRQAFDSLYERYSIRLFRSACLITGNKALAEDVLQETFLTCYLHIRELRRADSLKYWLYQIMTRTCHKLGKKYAKELPDEGIFEMSEQKGSHHFAGIEQEVIGSLAIREMLATLSEKEREAVILYYYDNLTTKEIAKILHLFEGTVKSRLYQSRKKLKQRFSNQKGEFCYETNIQI